MQPIRIVVAGVGLRSVFGIRSVLASPQFQLVGLIDLVPDRMELACQEFHLHRVACFTSLAECLAVLQFDALAVFTPDGVHAELVVPALRAGKYVFVEKPLEITAEKLDAIVHADQQYGGQRGRTFVGFNLRYAPVYVKVQELIRQGVVGQILTIQADEFYDAGRTYFRRWNRLRAISGGLWITKACHDFDLLYWIAGASPTRIYATSSLSYYHSGTRPQAAEYCRDCTLQKTCPDRFDLYMPPGDLWTRLYQVTENATGQKADLCLFRSNKDTFDCGIAQIAFSNGVMASYTVNVVAGFGNRRLRVSGTCGTIDVDLDRGEVVVLHRDPPRRELIDVKVNAAVHGGADEKVFPAFADFIYGRECRYVAPAEAAISVRMGFAAQLSCEKGYAVDLIPIESN